MMMIDAGPATYAGGTVTVSVVAVQAVTTAGSRPMRTVVAAVNPLPVIVSRMLPAILPSRGL